MSSECPCELSRLHLPVNEAKIGPMIGIPYGPILVVEDVPNIRDLLEVTLSFKGYPVTTARNGEEALEKISEQRPALIISDILMPQMDGFGLTQHLRINPLTRDIPIILISATYVSDEDKAFSKKLGVIRFLEKPIETDEFLLTVAELLTEGPPHIPDPLSDQEFYSGYLERLETKLAQKNKQIRRTERLLSTLAEEQKPIFVKLLQEEMAHRDSIKTELNAINARIAELENTGDVQDPIDRPQF